MKKLFVLFSLLFLFVPSADAKQMRAGLAKVIITPEYNIWMAGYANRNKPSLGKFQDLYAKALAITDDNGNRMVLVTADILGFTRELSESIAERAQQQYGLRRDQLMLNASHTHTGPVIRGNLIGAYQLDAEQATRIYEYSQFLQERVLWVIGQALKDMSLAKLSLGHGTGTFAMNRRTKSANGAISIGVNQTGVVDQDVPVLLIETKREALRGVVFGYACHNTTLTGEFYQLSGDYAGFAQAEIEKKHPGAIAMFVMGTGADINPNPRSTLALAQQHGASLAGVVEQVLEGKLKSFDGDVKTALDRVAIPFGTPPTREEFQQRLNDENVFKRKHADRMLARMIRDGKLPTSYPYTVQIFQIGNFFTLVGLAGEVVTDYSLRLKRELGTEGLWVAGYTNDVMAYIPSARMFSEGGYEVVDSMIYYDQPCSWSPELEDIIIGKTIELAESVGRKAKR
ncbi:MAG: neutral/alkaline non-lysosomal ceramidase N-terminal domain-containing protein [Acidobacteria bacterium]|nr:neutral/alkaline non-lysosomal ceramidase N-terminal domain-containing protein [Acidobacteriota bacterium]MBS1810764.1 neutral/alkaline non-lysosomal ceramidase N-terminal domain-containing protein [Acidobacteriota bacterium]